MHERTQGETARRLRAIARRGDRVALGTDPNQPAESHGGSPAGSSSSPPRFADYGCRSPRRARSCCGPRPARGQRDPGEASVAVSLVSPDAGLPLSWRAYYGRAHLEEEEYVRRLRHRFAALRLPAALLEEAFAGRSSDAVATVQLPLWGEPVQSSSLGPCGPGGREGAR
jgi:hypothetical protein